MKRVGYWMSEKKTKKLNFEDHVDMFRNAGVELLKIDIEKPLQDQGPYDMILHKFTDILVKAQQGYTTEQRIINNIEDYIENHPECIVVDPLDGIRKLLDRHEQYNLVLDCNTINTDSYMFIPTFVDLTSKDAEENRRKLADANVQYPFVCKPIVAHGTLDCHKMAVIFNENGLKDISPPCVAQTFINHNATLYKIFKIGSKQYIGLRPSLKNLYPGDHPTIFFDTHEVCKSDSSHHLTKPDYEDMESSPLKPDCKQLDRLSDTLRQKLGIDLFGVDVIIENDTQRYAVIDINVFPNYDEVDNFFGDLLDHLLFLLNLQQDKHSFITTQKQTISDQNTMLKQTGRSISLDSCTEHMSSKRLKTLDQEKECSCDSNKFPRGTCRVDSKNKQQKQEVKSTQKDHRYQRNSVGKSSACCILDDLP